MVFIKLKGKNCTLLMEVKNGVLCISELQQYFPNAVALSYIHNEETMIIELHSHNFQINSAIKEYTVLYHRSGERVKLKKLILKYFYANYKYKCIINMLKTKHNIIISLRSLERILRNMNLRRKNIKEIDMEILTAAIIIELENSGYNIGYRTLWLRLRRQFRFDVKQETVLQLLRQIDPEGVEGRKINKLHRRNYKVKGPNFLWHTDGYDKLKPFGFPIHGCIDGFSKKILWLEVSYTNNDPAIVAYFYLKTVLKYNCVPTLMRSDKGTENTTIECLQQCLRFNHLDALAGRKSFLIGKSTANQRIESTWCHLRKHTAGFYINLFKEMEADGLFKRGEWTHIECLRYCFGPLIAHDLNRFKKEWNQHKIRKQNNRNLFGGQPNIMYHLPRHFKGTECKKPIIKDHVLILMNEYGKKPFLLDERFSKLLKTMYQVPIPSSAEEAFELYKHIMQGIGEI